jgi:hypothetical protein
MSTPSIASLSSLSSLSSLVWHPTMANRFKFNGFHFLSNESNAFLTVQTVSASIEFDVNKQRELDEGLWSVTLTIEDNAQGNITNIINSVVSRFKYRHNTTFMEFSVMDESENLRSTLHLESVRLESAKLDFDYADNYTAKWILKFNAYSLNRVMGDTDPVNTEA